MIIAIIRNFSKKSKVSFMLSELYNEKLINLAANIPYSRLLESSHYSASTHSKICGSRIAVTIDMKDGIVTAYGQEVKACLLGQCAASVMGANIIGCSKQELTDVQDQMLTMLKSGGTPPTGIWSDLSLLLPVHDIVQRHSSVMLVFDAVILALEET